MVKEAVRAAAPQPADGGSAPAQLKRRVISGSVWTIAGYGVSQILRLAGNLVFAKLLFPEAFGLMALVGVFVQGLAMFSDIGIGPSIIQSRRGEELVFLNTAWTIQVGRGVVLWLVSVAGAVPFAAWYGEPQLASLIPVAALASVIGGFTSTKLFTASRRIAVARITLIEVGSSALGIAAMVVFCLISRSVWAIVFGGLCANLTKTILSHTSLPGERNRFTFERAAATELFGFGRWIFISTSLSFLAIQVDRLLLGKCVPIGQLGVYSIAASLATLAPTVASSLASSVLFPLFAHHSRTDRQAYERALYAARPIMLQGAMFLLGGLALLSPVFFRVMYDQRYAEAAWMAQLLTVAMWSWMLMISADRAVLAMGESRSLAIANGCLLVCKIAACVVGFQIAGLGGFVLGLAVGNLCGHIPIVLKLRQLGINIAKQDLKYTTIAVGVIGGGVLLQYWAASHLSARWHTWVELGVATGVLAPLGVVAVRHTMQAKSRQ